MSKTTKIVLSTVGVLGLLVVIGGFFAVRLFGSAITLDPEQVDSVAQEIVFHELPAGFEGIFATDIAGVQMALSGETVSNQEAIIMLMSFPDDDQQSQEQLTEEMRRSFEQQTGQQAQFELVGSRDIVIAGETVLVNTLIGESENGVNLRQDLAVFESLSGNIGMLMVVAPEDWFDTQKVDLFFDSMK